MHLRILPLVVTACLVFILASCAMLPSQKQNPTPPLAPVISAGTVTVTEGPSYDVAEFECLRSNLYFEAGNQTVRGMEAVALVVQTRTETKFFPNTICGVVKASAVVDGVRICQFTWYCDGKTDQPKLHNKAERKAWKNAHDVALRVITGQVPDFLGKSTNYHADYVDPKWNKAKRMKRMVKIGKHIFYRDVALKPKAA